jgi:hypothetical protein
MATRKKEPGLEPLVLHVGDEAFALTAIGEITEDDDGNKAEPVKVPVPNFGWLDQLSFKEQLEVRKIARELSGNAKGEPGDFAPMDVAPALITVVNQRTDEKFTLDDALALDWTKATTRPTKPSSA